MHTHRHRAIHKGPKGNVHCAGEAKERIDEREGNPLVQDEDIFLYVPPLAAFSTFLEPFFTV